MGGVDGPGRSLLGSVLGSDPGGMRAVLWTKGERGSAQVGAFGRRPPSGENSLRGDSGFLSEEP